MVETGSIPGRCLLVNLTLSPFFLPEMSQLFFGLLGAASNSLPSRIYAHMHALVITDAACIYRRKDSLPQ
jgi:hypothetical protein